MDRVGYTGSPKTVQRDYGCEDTFDEIALPQLEVTIPQAEKRFKPGDSLPLPEKFTHFPRKRRNSEVEISSFSCPSPLVPASSTAICRICLDAEPVDQLISPCECRGSQAFVHISCLQQWILRTAGAGLTYCELCRHAYHLKCESRMTIRFCPRKYHSHLWQPVTLLIASAVLLAILIISWDQGYIDQSMLVAFGLLASASSLLFLVVAASRVLSISRVRSVVLLPSSN